MEIANVKKEVNFLEQFALNILMNDDFFGQNGVLIVKSEKLRVKNVKSLLTL